MTLAVTLLLMVLSAVVAVAVDRVWHARPGEPPLVSAPLAADLPPLVDDAAPARTVTVRLLGTQGQCLGTMRMDRHRRRPTLQYRVSAGRPVTNFVAERQAEGEWLYREVGQEQE